MDKEINKDKKNIEEIDTDKLKEKYLKFRNISIGFYLFSFTVIAILFVMYLYSNKNNRMCQYGSTLYCDTGLTYPLTASTTQEYIEVTFNTPGNITHTTVSYPYYENNYNIDYYFGTTIPAVVTNRVEDIQLGISLNGSIGASLYYEYTDLVTGDNLQQATSYALDKSKLFAVFTSPQANILEYTYAYYGGIEIPTTTTTLFTSGSRKFGSTKPPQVSWMNLIEKLNTQREKGCKAGVSTIGCACIDPGYVTTKLCGSLVFNPTNGLYCEPDNPQCTDVCSDSTQISPHSNCGWRFCAPISYDPGTIQNLRSITNGYYQNAFTPGLRKSSNDSYKLGVNGPLLNTKLKGTPGFKEFNNYPTYQKINFCAGQASGKNNIDNDDIGETTDTFPSLSGYTPLDATRPNINSKNNFDF